MKGMRAYALSAAMCILAGCSDRVAGGGGTEETNGSLSGTLLDEAGAPVAGARIFLRDPGFLKDTAGSDSGTQPPDAITDAAGKFRKDSLAPGAWSIEIRGDSQQVILLEAKVAAGKTTPTGNSRLRKGGYLEGTITLAPEGDRGFIQVYGLDRFIRTDAKGHFVARNLPAGTLKTRFLTSRPGLDYPDGEKFAIVPEDTTRAGFIPWLEAYSKWAHSKDLILSNQSVGLAASVPGYPLLLRLDGSGIDFATADRRDLRVVNSAGRPLNHQIERWDSASGRAEIWVRMELLHADSAEQHLKIFWGNPAAADLASGKRVFADYDGVWHMDSPDCNAGEAVPAAGCRYAESSPSADPAFGMAALKMGALGPHARIAGSGMKAAGKPGMASAARLSLSAWFRADSGSAGESVIATYGDVYGMRLVEGDLQWYAFADTGWSGAGMPPATSWNREGTKGLALRDGAWHLAAAVWDGAQIRLYVDGEEALMAPAKIAPVYRLGTEFSIGDALSAEPPAPFPGDLDEVRVAAEAWSLSRMRAEFRFQKPGSKVATFK